MKGLKASHMNGLRGCIISYDEDSQRFGVLLSASSEQKVLKSINLELYAFSADSEGTLLGKEKLRKVMSLAEWLSLVSDLNLLDDSFSMRDATVVFVLSRMRVIDEKGKDAELKLQNLGVHDFYEAILRVACLKALPTDDEIAEVGAPP